MRKPLKVTPRDTIDDHRLTARYATLGRVDATKKELGRIYPRPMAPRSSEGDTQRLRGIPAIGRNVAGAVPGTDPSKLYAE